MMLWILALFVGVLLGLALYPGELSWFSPRGTRWLYDRAARGYSAKHHRHDYTLYDAAVTAAAHEVLEHCDFPRVLDLGCGGGRATRAAARALGQDARYVAVDFSPSMLEEMRRDPDLALLLERGELELQCADIAAWLALSREQGRRFDLLLLMEVGEFLPGFPLLLKQLGEICSDEARLVMTRPAGWWSWWFPLRAQRPGALSRALVEAGFSPPCYQRWRSRYELLRCARKSPRL